MTSLFIGDVKPDDLVDIDLDPTSSLSLDLIVVHTLQRNHEVLHCHIHWCSRIGGSLLPGVSGKLLCRRSQASWSQ
jgi:hypothetical protein